MHIERPKDPLIKFIDGWDTVPEMEAALGVPEGSLGKAMYAGFTVGGVVRARRTSPTMARATHAVDSWGGSFLGRRAWREEHYGSAVN
jgi:hypothetical protein